VSQLALIVFWAACGAVAFAYAGYPLLTIAVGTMRNRTVRSADNSPSVSVLIAAYNEADRIAERIENVLGSDYPHERIEVIIASDGSTDATAAIGHNHGDPRVKVLELPRRGKIAALDDAVRLARGEILIFSDANTVFHREALRALVRGFADEEVGGVVGHTYYRVSDNAPASGRGEDLYWRYDTRMKEMESRSGSVVSAHGGLYAIRKALYRKPAETSVTDDFAISTAVIAEGRRLVFEPAALAYEIPAPEDGGEFARRVRLMTRGLRAVMLRRSLLNPFAHGYYSVSLFTRKVLRRLVPLALPVLLVTSAVLATHHVMYALAFAGQVAFYTLAAVGFLARRTSAGRWRCLYIPFFYCMANAAATLALLKFLRGDRISLWQPQRGAAGV